MNDIHLFLAHAIRLEQDAARRFEELAETMRSYGNRDVEQFFRLMAHYSRQHLAEATARGGFRSPPKLANDEYQWPDDTSPEAADWSGIDGLIDIPAALELAYASELRGLKFYADIAAATTNPRVRHAAEEFAAEERQHVSELERWMVRYPAAA